MNDRLTKANKIKEASIITSKEFKKWNESEAGLQSQCEEYLKFFPNIGIVRIPNHAYRAIFANNHVSQRVKGLISSFLKGVPDFILIKKGEISILDYKFKQSDERLIALILLKRKVRALQGYSAR